MTVTNHFIQNLMTTRSFISALLTVLLCAGFGISVRADEDLGRPAKTLKASVLRKLLSGKTKSEVRTLIGKPDLVSGEAWGYYSSLKVEDDDSGLMLGEGYVWFNTVGRVDHVTLNFGVKQ